MFHLCHARFLLPPDVTPLGVTFPIPIFLLVVSLGMGGDQAQHAPRNGCAPL